MNATQVPISETYEDCEHYLEHIVWRFHLRHGGRYGADFEEMLGEARLVFLKVYEKFEAGRGHFLAFLRTAVERRLIDLHRHEQRKSVAAVQASDTPEIFVDHQRSFSLSELLDGLTEDARLVVRLVLDTPGDFTAALGTRNRNCPRLMVEDYLKGLGWRPMRIRNCLEKLEQALS